MIPKSTVFEIIEIPVQINIAFFYFLIIQKSSTYLDIVLYSNFLSLPHPFTLFLSPSFSSPYVTWFRSSHWNAQTTNWPYLSSPYFPVFGPVIVQIINYKWIHSQIINQLGVVAFERVRLKWTEDENLKSKMFRFIRLLSSKTRSFFR